MQGCRPRDGTPPMVRDIVPADALQLGESVTGTSDRIRRWRCHGGANGLTQARLEAMCTPSEAGLALVATDGGTVVADVRCTFDAASDGVEFGLMVAEGWLRRGLASHCPDALASVAAARGMRWFHGTVMAENVPMRARLRQHARCCGPCREDAGLVAAASGVALAAGLAA